MTEKNIAGLTKRCDELVEALREAAGDYTAWNKTLGYQAADEIERLRRAPTDAECDALEGALFNAECFDWNSADTTSRRIIREWLTKIRLPDEPPSSPTA